MPEVGDRALAGDPRRRHLALDAALAEAAGDQDPVDALEPLGLEVLGVDQLDLDLDAVVEAAVLERLDHRLVGVGELHVLADQGDPHLALGGVGAAHHRLPLGQVGRRRLHAEVVEHQVVDALGAEDERHLVDVVDVVGGDHRVGREGWRRGRSCSRISRSSRPSERQTSACGWIPIRRSSLTECWVGFVFSSPAWPT